MRFSFREPTRNPRRRFAQAGPADGEKNRFAKRRPRGAHAPAHPAGDGPTHAPVVLFCHRDRDLQHGRGGGSAGTAGDAPEESA